MKVSELKLFLDGLPDDMEILRSETHEDSYGDYLSYLYKVDRVRTETVWYDPSLSFGGYSFESPPKQGIEARKVVIL